MGSDTFRSGIVSPSSCTLSGIWMPVSRYRLSARKVPYLKKPSSSRLKITDWATNRRAFLSLSRYFSTRMPWV